MRQTQSLLQANAGPWVRLAQETGAVVKWWPVQRRPPFATPLGDLKDLLSPRSACPSMKLSAPGKGCKLRACLPS